MTEPCDCPACKLGLYCADGQRGQFVRGVDACARCGAIAWRHRTTFSFRCGKAKA